MSQLLTHNFSVRVSYICRRFCKLKGFDSKITIKPKEKYFFLMNQKATGLQKDRYCGTGGTKEGLAQQEDSGNNIKCCIFWTISRQFKDIEQ